MLELECCKKSEFYQATASSPESGSETDLLASLDRGTVRPLRPPLSGAFQSPGEGSCSAPVRHPGATAGGPNGEPLDGRHVRPKQEPQTGWHASPLRVDAGRRRAHQGCGRDRLDSPSTARSRRAFRNGSAIRPSRGVESCQVEGGRPRNSRSRRLVRAASRNHPKTALPSSERFSLCRPGCQITKDAKPSAAQVSSEAAFGQTAKEQGSAFSREGPADGAALAFGHVWKDQDPDRHSRTAGTAFPACHVGPRLFSPR